MNIELLYQDRLLAAHNITAHLPMLREYAEKCRHVTEFGVDIGFSTTAFLAARPEQLHSYDIAETPWVYLLGEMAQREGLSWHFHQRDTLDVEICETDLLLIDGEHTAEQVAAELELHAGKVRRWIALHDVVSCPVIVPAIRQFLDENPEWEVEIWDTKQSGLAILRRKV